ncbi:MAG TPA: hypothetical protein VFQ38_09325 [Longimicrobiales bacterium]|nr:hypothetical protein [Longimicrobiales bacterium]
MTLALSSAAAPDLALPDLVGACERRGLGALELVATDAHGLRPGLPPAEAQRLAAAARERGVDVVAYRDATGELARDASTARFAAALGLAVVVPVGALALDEALLAAQHYAGAGATLLLAVDGRLETVDAALRLVSVAPAGALAVAWDAAPGPALVDARETLRRIGPALRHIRLLGGGPEAAGKEGAGIGPLMAALALQRYAGAVAIAPSTPRFRIAWSHWLGRRAWGCGSAGEASLTPLSTPETHGAEA